MRLPMNKSPNDKPSSPPAPGAIRLTHAAIVTANLDRSIAFYTDILGLALRVKEEDPLRKGRQRAMLVDAAGVDVIEAIEFPEMPHASITGRGAIHHIGFRLPQQHWIKLRLHLDTVQYPYKEVEGRLFVRDADGIVLEIEQGEV